jgi:hypothetical protein
MKRTLLSVLLVLTIIGLSGSAIRYEFKKREQKRRQTAYVEALSSYTQVLRPGMTRKEVEGYLHARNIEFAQTCCVDSSETAKRHSWDDLARIGREDPPWYCGENNVYIAFQFKDHNQGQEATGFIKNDDFDTLKAVTIYHSLERCL